jgi:hypothetical protein
MRTTSALLVAIKLLHTLIFLVESAAILYILYCAVTGCQDVWLLVAVVLVLLEMVVFLANRARCPLTKVAQRLGDPTGNDFIADIFLPARFAPLIPRVCGTLAVIGLLGLLARALLH